MIIRRVKWGTDKEVELKTSPGSASHIGIAESRGTEQHSPSTSREAKKADLAFVRRTRKGLRKEIRAVVFRRAVLKDYFLRVDFLANEMMTYVDVFRASMELVIVGERDGRLIVGKEFGRSGGRKS